MTLLTIMLSVLLAGLASYAMAQARSRALRSSRALRVVYWVAGLMAAVSSLWLVELMYPSLQAVFIWLGVMSLAATATVFLLPKMGYR